MNLRNKNGSITIFVLVGLLFMSAFLVISYANNVNRSKIAKEQSEIINSIYQMKVLSTNEIYDRLTAVPTIGEIPTPIITNITNVQDSYVTYDGVDKNEETYTITFEIDSTNVTFTDDTMIEAVDEIDKWLLDNKKYEIDAELKIIAKGNNNSSSEGTQNIKFIRGVKVTNESELTTALASTSPSYIQVANDIVCNNTISLDGVTHKLDLNNKNISYTLSSTEEATYTFLTLGTNTNLTVIDSSSEKQGKILAKLEEEANADGNNRRSSIIGVKNSGKLNIESGTIATSNRIIINKVESLTNKGLGVHSEGVAIQNIGEINLNGGIVSSNVITQGCAHLAIQISRAVSKGIVNEGIINVTSGNIIANSDAYVLRMGVPYGRTMAGSFGIVNSGTINNSEKTTFSIKATPHEENTTGNTNKVQYANIINPNEIADDLIIE